jgi:pimeloyl-ACP methyl ester carboxylesterase
VSTTPLATTSIGDGPPIWLVHGQLADPVRAWSRLAPLADRWRLIFVHRPGYGSSPATGRSDWVSEGERLGEIIEPGAHLVGHSYGAMVAMVAASRMPVASLTLIEPPAFSLVRGEPSVEALLADVEAIQADAEASPAQALRRFLASQELAADVPDELPRELTDHVTLVRTERLPWGAAPPTAELAREPYAKLVLSGGDGKAREHVADVLAVAIGARRLVIPGGGHNAHRLGARFNDALENFLLSVTRQEPHQ